MLELRGYATQQAAAWNVFRVSEQAEARQGGHGVHQLTALRLSQKLDRSGSAPTCGRTE